MSLPHLYIWQKERDAQFQTLSAKIEELEADMLSKERELRKMTTKRDKEVTEYKKQLASITQELEAEKQKTSHSSVQEVIV